MKCPVCKKAKLETAKTFGEDSRIVRHRRCTNPKCREFPRTVEIFENDLKKLNDEIYNLKHQRTLEQYALENTQAEIGRAVRTLLEAAGIDLSKQAATIRKGKG